MKKLLFFMMIISCFFINIGCKKTTQTSEINTTVSPSKSETEKDNSLIPTNTSEPFIGRTDLDSETEKFIYGTWKVEKLLGFANSWNDASEYPTGQKIIDDEIIINKDFFSSQGLKNYKDYQYELKNPSYSITEIYYNQDSFYRVNKIDIPGVDINDEIKALEVASCHSEMSIPMCFLLVNNDRLILMLESTIFELKNVTD